ncbi:hypothetical protein [Algoriphagus confluentis]|uniref:Lipocalin-like domain-containing protein n=1 Tax=Algoriphagus confluentis TaxID=1697556 RepID=A0ABQ6PRQ3_9BACT|nr:hypothetical protein Aconfl_32540 [Algoriphagus confluentis]
MNKLPILILLLALYSCNLDGNEDTNNSDISVSQLSNDLTTSSGLRIVQFIEDGEDETSDVDGFRFDFKTDGTVTATQGNQVISGTYRVFRDDGETELAMAFPSNSVLNKLTDDWYFRGKSNNRLTFEDDDEDLERLVFEF